MESGQPKLPLTETKGSRPMRSLATAALISALFVTACGGGSTTPAPAVGGQPAASQAGAANAATIVDFAFQPSSLTIAKGSSVTWTNTGSRGHTFDTAGTFAYHCSIHSQMKATVTVTP